MDHSFSVCEEHVFNELYTTHAEGLRNHLYYKFGDLNQAEDIVQEAFIKLWQNCKKVTPSKAKSFCRLIKN